MTEDEQRAAVHYSADGEPLAVQARRLVVENQRLTAIVRGVEALAEELREASRLPISSEFDRGIAAHQRDAAARLRGLITSSDEATP